MQTLSVQIKDSYVKQFMSFVKDNHSNISISKDKNLELESSIHESKKELKQIQADVKSSKSKILSEKQYQRKIKQFFSVFKNKYESYKPKKK